MTSILHYLSSAQMSGRSEGVEIHMERGLGNKAMPAATTFGVRDKQRI